MPEPAPDELAGGSARDPLRASRWLRAATLVALAGVAGWVLIAQHPPTHASGSDPPSIRLGPPAPITLSPSPAQRAIVRGSQPGLLGVRAVCLRTGRADVPALGVDLVNGRLARTTLLAVTPVTGAGASTRGGTTLPARRTCDGRPSARDSLVMRPGGVVPLTVDLPDTDLCGARPVSVQVDVSFLGPGETPATQRLVLHPDPDELDVRVCATGAAEED